MAPDELRLWSGLVSSWDAWLLTFVLAIVVPTVGYVRFRKLLAAGDSADPRRARLALYGRIIRTQWLLVGAMFVVLGLHGLSARDVGQRLGDARVTCAATVSLIFILGVVFAIMASRVRRARREQLETALGRFRWLVPTSGAELLAFAAVCLTAGICEELLYRGWLVNLLLALTGSTWVAVALGAVVFGLAHAYQGAIGVLRTAVIGLQLAVLFVGVGSLIPGQVLHTGVDLVAGMYGVMAASRLNRLNDPSAARPS